MDQDGRKSFTGKYRHIDIRYLFAKDKVEIKKMPIAYCSTEHMLADIFTKALQGSLFAKFCDIIMGWKHVDMIQMGPPSTKELVGDVVKIRSNKEEIESTMETERGRIESSEDTGGEMTGCRVETKEDKT